MSSTTFDYEAALGFVISIRPRLAVEDADQAARRLLGLLTPDPLEVAVEEKDWATVALLSPDVMGFVRQGKKIQAIKELRTIMYERYPEGSDGMGNWLKAAKDAVESRAVTEAVSA